MNLKRVVSLLRDLADALEEEETPSAETAPAPRRKRPAPKAHAFPPPVGDRAVSETDMMRARAMLRRRGLR